MYMIEVSRSDHRTSGTNKHEDRYLCSILRGTHALCASCSHRHHISDAAVMCSDTTTHCKVELEMSSRTIFIIHLYCLSGMRSWMRSTVRVLLPTTALCHTLPEFTRCNSASYHKIKHSNNKSQNILQDMRGISSVPIIRRGDSCPTINALDLEKSTPEFRFFDAKTKDNQVKMFQPRPILISAQPHD